MKVLAALLIGVFVFIGAYFFGQEQRKRQGALAPSPAATSSRATKDQAATTSSVSVAEGGAAFSLSPPSSTLSSGDTLSLNINLRASGLNLSAGAVRIIFSFSEELPLEPIDANDSKEGLQANLSTDFISSGWSFPINEVVVDRIAKKVNVDLAFVNLGPDGFSASGDYRIASLDFSAVSKASEIIIEFEPQLTKLITKDGKEVELGLNGATYSVR